MSKDLQIPLLHDLIEKGPNVVSDDLPEYPTNEHHDLEIAADEIAGDTETQEAVDTDTTEQPVEDSGDGSFNSIQELLIEEEIRIILDKHMDHAYEEIIHLINHKLAK